MNEKNNTLALTRQDLTRTLDDLFTEVSERPGCVGWVILTYEDQSNQYTTRIKKPTFSHGYHVSCIPLKGSPPIRLGETYSGKTTIGTMILITVEAENQSIEEFFKVPAAPPQSPSPAEVLAGRERAGLTQTGAAALVHAKLRSWQQWEAGDRAMHAGFWELFQIKSARIERAPKAAKPPRKTT